MKKTLFIMLSIVMACFCSASLTLAADITLTDTACAVCPGITNISLSNAVKVSYTGATTAGGYGGVNAGEQWAVTTGSKKAKADMALEFIMRGSEGVEDNNLYQRINSTITAGLTAPTLDPSAVPDVWRVRGGS